VRVCWSASTTLGEHTRDPTHADAVVVAYLDLLTRLREAGLSSSAEVSIKLTALGQQLRDGPQLALENAELICRAARMADTAVTLDMEDPRLPTRLWRSCTDCAGYPDTGAVLQAYLYRPKMIAGIWRWPDRGVRLCKGAYAEPARMWHSKIGRDRQILRTLHEDLDGGCWFPLDAGDS
jgi:proline dehydrogenase